MARWENCIGYGTHAARPAAGAPGALYFESDTGNAYRDNGATWDHVATTASAARTVIFMDDNLTLDAGNVFVIVTVADKTLTLPPAAANTGLGILARVSNLSSAMQFSVSFPPGESVESLLTSPTAFFNVVSDGVQWRGFD